MSHRRARLRRRVVVSAAALTIIVFAMVARRWRVIRMLYSVSRLDQAESFETARKILGTVARDTRDPYANQIFVDRLGPGRMRATFWFLTYIFWQPEPLTDEEALSGPAHLEHLAPLTGGLLRRSALEPHFLDMLMDYQRWHGGISMWEGFDRIVKPPPMKLMDLVVSIVIGDSALGHGEPHPDWLAILYLDELCLSCIAGLPLHPANPKAIQEVKTLRKECVKWLRAHWKHLRYDPATNGCVLVPESEPPDVRPFAHRGIPSPRIPFRGWTGPVPEKPGRF